MRKANLAVLAIFGLALVVPGADAAQQAQSQPKPETQSLADAARKAREKKGQQAQQKSRVFTNDNLPAAGSVNVVGSEQQPQGEQAAATGAGQAQGEQRGEQYWRNRFDVARKQLSDAEKELDILQRELEQKRLQYYDDPQKTLQEELDRKAVNDHSQKIEAKKQQVERLRQAVTDLEDELRKAGGSPGWSRP